MNVNVKEVEKRKVILETIFSITIYRNEKTVFSF